MELVYGDLLPQGDFVLHSRFCRVSNFSNERNELLSVTDSVSLLTPATIVCDFFDFRKIDFFSYHKRHFNFDNRSFQFPPDSAFDSRFCVKNADFETMKAIISANKNWILCKFSKAGLFAIFNRNTRDENLSRFEKAYAVYAQNARNLIENGNFIEGLSLLKGTGRGLTPSGDDYIAGFLHGLYLIAQTKKSPGEKRAILMIIRQIFENSGGKNLISNTLLHHASQGRMFYSLKCFIESLFDMRNDLDERLNEVLGMGESSGSDILTGLFDVFEFYR